MQDQLTILDSYPYDNEIITQGIEIDKNKIIVSSGGYEDSKIGFLDLETGKLSKQKKLDDMYFAEGITIVGDSIWQLTWLENTAFLRDINSLDTIKEVSYDDQGWGICYTGDVLIMSNGTDVLSFRDPTSFEELSTIEIEDNSEVLFGINELEYANGYVYANVMESDFIYKIDITTGQVVDKYDASFLLREKGISDKERGTAGVLNGIAHVKGNTFLVTGKNWPKIFKVELK